MKAASQAIITDFISLIYPQLCAGCRKSLYKNEKCICTYCRYHLPRTHFHLEEDNPVFRMFWGRVNIHHATAYYFFNKGMRVQRLIHQLKYHGRTEVGQHIGELFGNDLRESPFYRDVDVVVPVPLHRKKLKIRGYNQSEVIAAGIAAGMQRPLDNASFIRCHFSETQTRKSRFKRWENVKSIFKVVSPDAFTSKHILLVDDVVTTGATLEACAQELLKCSDTRVSIGALAYAVKSG